jgi:hypothetical protein
VQGQIFATLYRRRGKVVKQQTHLRLTCPMRPCLHLKLPRRACHSGLTDTAPAQADRERSTAEKHQGLMQKKYSEYLSTVTKSSASTRGEKECNTWGTGCCSTPARCLTRDMLTRRWNHRRKARTPGQFGCLFFVFFVFSQECCFDFNSLVTLGSFFGCTHAQ